MLLSDVCLSRTWGLSPE